MREFIPSFQIYREIIRDIQKTGKACGYAEAQNRDQFVIMRHDIEFSIDRAFRLSKVEKEMGFSSTYFVQMTNNSYNPFSRKNVRLLREMEQDGHTIGLHYHLNGQRDSVQVRDGVRDQVRIMSEMLGMQIRCFSFHRPVKEIYYYSIQIPEALNAYAPQFFTYADQVDEKTELEIKYIADSKHRWNYAYPDYETLMKHPKIQILIHPFSWTETGFDNLNNFRTLIEEKQSELIATLDDEFQRFREIKSQLIKSPPQNGGI